MEIGKTTTTTNVPATFQVAQIMETSLSLKKKISKIRWLFRIQTTYAAACLESARIKHRAERRSYQGKGWYDVTLGMKLDKYYNTKLYYGLM